MKRWVALILAIISIASPCLAALSLMTRQVSGGEVKGKMQKMLPIYCVDTKGVPKVAITFDAAWGDEDAEEIRSILNQHEVKATFFMVGDWMRKYPELVKKLAEDGHDMANHSNKHPHVCQMDKEAIKKDLMAAHNEIKNLTGQECNLYRPPYGEYNNTVLQAAKECGYHTIQWDVDSLDWKEFGVQPVVDRVTRNVRNGSIVLFHNNAKYIKEFLPLVIERLQEDGYEIVPISELIYKENFIMDNTGRQILQK